MPVIRKRGDDLIYRTNSDRRPTLEWAGAINRAVRHAIQTAARGDPPPALRVGSDSARITWRIRLTSFKRLLELQDDRIIISIAILKIVKHTFQVNSATQHALAPSGLQMIDLPADSN